MGDRNHSDLLTNPKTNEHVALLYDDAEQLNAHVAEYINEGLKRGQFCVYATVHFRDEEYIEKLSALVADYKYYVEKGDLLIIDLAPFYISALLGDTKPFEDARKLFAERVKNRTDKHVRFFGDGTGFLFKNKHFDECALIEQWWQEKPFEGSYVCPFPKSFFHTFPHDMYSERAVVATHDVVMDISDGSPQTTREKQATPLDVPSGNMVDGDYDVK